MKETEPHTSWPPPLLPNELQEPERYRAWPRRFLNNCSFLWCLFASGSLQWLLTQEHTEFWSGAQEPWWWQRNRGSSLGWMVMDERSRMQHGPENLEQQHAPLLLIRVGMGTTSRSLHPTSFSDRNRLSQEATSSLHWRIQAWVKQ